MNKCYIFFMRARKLFGNRVSSLRKSKSMTQNDLAFKSGLVREYISTVECGKRNVSIDAIEKIAKALEVSIKDLFEFEEMEK